MFFVKNLLPKVNLVSKWWIFLQNRRTTFLLFGLYLFQGPKGCQNVSNTPYQVPSADHWETFNGDPLWKKRVVVPSLSVKSQRSILLNRYEEVTLFLIDLVSGYCLERYKTI